MLRPVKLDTARNPRTCKTDKRRLYYLIIINRVVIIRLIENTLYSSAYLGQNHNKQVFIFQIYRRVHLIRLFVRNAFAHRVRINASRASLINSFFEKHRYLTVIAYFICRDCNVLDAYFYSIHGSSVLSVLLKILQKDCKKAVLKSLITRGKFLPLPMRRIFSFRMEADEPRQRKVSSYRIPMRSKQQPQIQPKRLSQ